MQEIGIGIIGSGFMGRTHAEAFASHTHGARLVAVTGGSRCAELARDYSIDAEPSVAGLLERSDVAAVVIATPQKVHAEQVIATATHRKHVLLEKPMAVSLDQCRAMNNACSAAGVNLMVGFTQRFRQGNIRAKNIIDAGGIGRIRFIRETMIGTDGRTVYPRWQQERDNRGTLLGYGVHSIDRIRWFTGTEVSAVMAQSVAPGGKGAEYS
jgi:predicted dehydrogenase